MTFTKMLSIAALTTLTACAGTTTPPATGTATTITTEAAFRSTLVGKTIGFAGNTFVINADNTVSGPWDGTGITGTWSWEDQYWCRDIAIGGTARNPDCQIWTVEGTSATVTRDRGNGSSFTYSIN